MTQVKDIYRFLCEEAPLELQMSFDNSGLQIGRLSKEVSKVLLALDVTDDVLDEAIELGAELIILDFKFASDEDYRKYTGGSLTAVLETLSFLIENKKRIWVRTVVVPDINDSEEALCEYIRVLHPYRDGILKYELLPFHTMGFFKYEKMGKENPLANTPPMDMDRLRKLQEIVNQQY